MYQKLSLTVVLCHTYLSKAEVVSPVPRIYTLYIYIPYTHTYTLFPTGPGFEFFFLSAALGLRVLVFYRVI